MPPLAERPRPETAPNSSRDDPSPPVPAASAAADSLLSLARHYGWQGREFDADTALEYDRVTCYDPTPGRWTSEDPLGFNADDVNLYRYDGHSPSGEPPLCPPASPPP